MEKSRAPVPVTQPSALNSTAALTTELAKPVIGTRVPAPARVANFWYQPATVATVVARTEVTALRVNSAVIYEFIMNSPKLLAQCVYMVAGDLYQRSGNDGILYYYRGIDRVRYYLVQYCGLHGRGDGEVWVDADYQTIASNIGVSVRTVVRSIRTLKEQGEITSVRKKISISPDQYQTMLDAILPLLHS